MSKFRFKSAQKKHESALLALLETLASTEEAYSTHWMHETTIAFLMFGSQTGGAVRKAHRLLRRLERRKLVEHSVWVEGIGWRLKLPDKLPGK